MDLGGASYFLSGLLIGSLLDTTTTLILLIIGVTLTNKPLPDICGGVRPQELLRALIMKTGILLKNLIKEQN